MLDFFNDAPAALSFVLSQRTHIESEVMSRPYPEIKYPRMIPVDTSANEFAPSVTFFTQDIVGRPKMINGKGDDIPLANVTRNKFEQTVGMAGIGYSFGFEEMGAAAQLGMNLSSVGAAAARLSYEQFVDAVAMEGEAGFEGLFNTTGIASAASGTTFAAGTAQQNLTTINTALDAVTTATNGIDLADTIVLPLAGFTTLSSKQLAPESSVTVLEFLRQNNSYTALTGQPLTIFADHRLSGKMVVYKRDPSVLKLHMPMPLRFLPPQPRGLEIFVPGVFRFAPISIRKPLSVRYVTGL